MMEQIGKKIGTKENGEHDDGGKELAPPEEIGKEDQGRGFEGSAKAKEESGRFGLRACKSVGRRR